MGLLLRVLRLHSRFHDEFGKAPTEVYIPKREASDDAEFGRAWFEAQAHCPEGNAVTVYGMVCYVHDTYARMMVLDPSVGSMHEDDLMVSRPAPIARELAPERGMRFARAR